MVVMVMVMVRVQGERWEGERVTSDGGEQGPIQSRFYSTVRGRSSRLFLHLPSL